MFRKHKLCILSSLLVVSFLIPNNISIQVSAATTIPDLELPADGWIFTGNRNFLFDWSACVDDGGPAINYEIQVSSEPDFSSLEFSAETDLDSEYYYITYYNLDDGLFFWRVCAEGFFQGWSDWSEIWNFTIAMYPPQPPVLLSPSQNEYINTNLPEYDWEDSLREYHTGSWGQYPGSYIIQVSNSSDFSYLFTDKEVLTSNYTSEVALSDGDYWWKVKPIGTLGSIGSWSSIRNFTIDTLNPVPPTLESPDNNLYTNEPYLELDWEAVSDAKEYHVQLSNTEFFSPTFYNEIINTNNFSIPTYLSDGSYYWRVRTIDFASNVGGWSSVWNFTVDTTKPDIQGITMDPLTPDEKSEITIYCSVSDLSTIESVVLLYSIDRGDWTLKNTTKLSNIIYYATIGPFDSGETLYFYFRATDVFGYSAFNSIISVTIMTDTAETGISLNLSSIVVAFLPIVMIVIIRRIKNEKLRTKEIS